MRTTAITVVSVIIGVTQLPLTPLNPDGMPHGFYGALLKALAEDAFIVLSVSGTMNPALYYCLM